jgi:hydrogenase maturation protease
MPAPTLIIGYGNPSRGDDALGPLALAALEQHLADAGQIEYLTDFQLQIELVTDMAGRERVIFIDADVSLEQPFSFTPLQAQTDAFGTSHALAPASLLGVYRNFYACAAPPAFLLAIRGYQFELGAALSDAAMGNLDAAVQMLESWLAQPVPPGAQHAGAQICHGQACHA